eukprot:COSAG02_NODE_576_length_20112_cov_13.577625_4_plen_163_part_00
MIDGSTRPAGGGYGRSVITLPFATTATASHHHRLSLKIAKSVGVYFEIAQKTVCITNSCIFTVVILKYVPGQSRDCPQHNSWGIYTRCGQSENVRYPRRLGGANGAGAESSCDGKKSSLRIRQRQSVPFFRDLATEVLILKVRAGPAFSIVGNETHPSRLDF